MSLLTLQRAFCADILNPSPALSGHIEGDSDAGLAVYRSAFRLRLAESLRETYEKTWAWLGDEAFDDAVRNYVETHPPQSWTLADYGEGFSDTLTLLYPGDYEVSELAWLEWTMHRAFAGPDATALTPDKCGDIDWDRAVLTFVPTLQVRPVATNCGALWAAMAANDTPPPAETFNAPAALCVWRKDLSPSFRTLDARDYDALRLAISGAAFGEICRLLSEGRPESETVAELGAMLARWLQDEMIATISQG